MTQLILALFLTGAACFAVYLLFIVAVNIGPDNFFALFGALFGMGFAFLLCWLVAGLLLGARSE